jgi:hypothetical protein
MNESKKVNGGLVGQNYISKDTSYLINLTCIGHDVRLSGNHHGKDPVLTKIVSEPYEFTIRNKYKDGSGAFVKHTFINVEYKKDIFRVLYDSENVNADLEKRIIEHNNFVEYSNSLNL